ncbi:MAG: penicillin-binding protein 1C [Holophagales bacterium]|nr:penicillin-binding protein 1C [Holophagales bacterium]MYF97138.1 penicillin-binding protein 1C [Holophagales bacterium]
MRSRRFWIALGAVLLLAAAWAAIPKPDLYEGVGFSTLVTDRNGRPLKLRLADDGRYRLFASLGDIAEAAREATLLYEDRRFFRHPGVDPLALARAAWTTYVRRTRPVGGSTITMQLARMRFDLDTRSPTGKLIQSARAVQLERHYSKAEILEAYLNLAPYGGSVEGIATASRIYFDKPASALDLGEALALAVIPQNPASRFPITVPGRANLRAARSRLLGAWQAAHATGDEEVLARAELLPVFRSPASLPDRAPHFVRDRVPRDGRSAIRTTIDLDLQDLVERRIREHVDQRRREGIENAAVMLIEHRRMEVLAFAGSADFGDGAIAGQVNGVLARRSPGSTLKPLVYGLALEEGLIHPMTLLEDAPRRYAAFAPENFDRGFMGPVFARDALIDSRNLPAASLLEELDVGRFRDWLEAAGVDELMPAEHYGLALALGGSEMTMEELVRLYATLAAGGVWRELATTPGGEEAPSRRLLSAEASFLVLDMLRDVPRPDSSSHRMVVRQPIAWKTGTSFGFRDAWSVGVAGPYVLAVWVGNFDGSPNPAFVGREAAAPLFFAIADSLRLPAVSDHPPPGLNVRRVEVCASTGDLPGPHCPRTTLSWFVPGVSPIKESSVYRAVRIDPSTGFRTCRDDIAAVQEVYEFWPSNLNAVFRRAGVSIRRPPPWSPECELDRTSASGVAPRIASPQNSLVYHSSARGGEQSTVLFSAVADGDARSLYWFVDDRFVARVAAGKDYLWAPRAGRFTVRVADDLGRGDAVSIVVAGRP